MICDKHLLLCLLRRQNSDCVAEDRGVRSWDCGFGAYADGRMRSLECLTPMRLECWLDGVTNRDKRAV